MKKIDFKAWHRSLIHGHIDHRLLGKIPIYGKGEVEKALREAYEKGKNHETHR